MVNNTLGPLKVLIAEDNEINKLIAKTVLKRWGFTTTLAPDGAEAVIAVENNDFDLVLMDIQMPNKDGITATKDIRAMPSQAKNNLPIIALTANTQMGINDKYLELGMDGYLSKPFKEEDLYNLITTVIEKRKKML
ncbi:response regulator [Parasediminibacterium sp. JCM 36343]|uniref:response regulator n=1 Tax=Parasediminibacterium sp. JCM 36343 TaxID=3374279 RepID=UPI00397D1E2B